MTRLEIRLLGSFETALDDRPVTDFESETVRGLLAYLAAYPGRFHQRSTVAELFWPERPEGAGLANLRHALATLRSSVGDRDAVRPVLDASRHQLRLDPEADVWIDLLEFNEHASVTETAVDATVRWEKAIALHRGLFLADLDLRVGSDWEEWIVITREQTSRTVVDVLRKLTDRYEVQGAYGKAVSTVRRLLEMDPWDEQANRRLMRLLAMTDQRSEALSQYEVFAEMLRSELGSSPADATRVLYEQIRDGWMPPETPIPVRLPGFLTGRAGGAVPGQPFVDRDAEVSWLMARLRAATTGAGQAMLVSGEAGIGKTMLLHEFARRAQAAVPELVVAGGRCNAYTGTGDPYLPFRQILNLLAGDVESQWIAGGLTRDHAEQLWMTMPDTARLLLDRGPDLVGSMIDGRSLVVRLIGAAPTAPWVRHLRDLAESVSQRPAGAQRAQPAVFDAYAQVLTGLSLRRPLLLVVDDLQWIDQGSIGLLFHLARLLSGFRIALALAFRSEAIEPGRTGGSGPVSSLLNELRITFGDCALALEGNGAFIDALLDVDTNRIGSDFRRTLHRYTGGNPLFVTELLAGMKERGEVILDAGSIWVAAEHPDWDRVPARVEAVVAERLARATPSLAADLRVAAVQGEDFVAESVAAVRGVDAVEVNERLAEAARPPLRVVEPVGVERVDGAVRSRYRFRHLLFQRCLYRSLDELQRVRLHEETGRALEQAHENDPEAIAVDLVRNFEEGGRPDKAIQYAQMAAQRALRLSAHDEAIIHLRHALELVSTLPATSERDRLHLGLLVALGAALQAARGYAAPDTGDAYARAEEICQRLGDAPEVAQALAAAATFQALRGRFDQAVDLSEKLLNLAGRLGDPLYVALAQLSLGWQLLPLGRIAEAHHHLQQMVDFYEPARHGWLAFAFGTDPGVTALAWSSWTLWFLGYPDQADEEARQTIDLARQQNHSPTLAFALAVAGVVFQQIRGEFEETIPTIDELEALAGREHLAQFEAFALVYRGYSEGKLGDPQDGIARIRQGLADLEGIGTDAYRANFLVNLADLCVATGELQEAQSMLEAAQELIDRTGERFVQPTLHLATGQVRLAARDHIGAETAFEAASQIARTQGNRMLELRAAIALSELRQGQVRADEPLEQLRSVYEWFTEGFDTPDLVAARALLDRV